MASVFPDLFDFSSVGVLVLRLAVAIFFILFGTRLTQAVQMVKDKGNSVVVLGYVYGIAHLLVGIFLLVGLYTQIMAILGMLLSTLSFAQGVNTQSPKGSQQVHILLFFICFSLLFFGAGIFAVDIPF